MSNRLHIASSGAAQRSFTPVCGGVLQRACACGAHAPGPAGECAECRRKRRLGRWTKLVVNHPGDRHEQEADRVAEQVMRMANPAPIPISYTGAAVPARRTVQRRPAGEERSTQAAQPPAEVPVPQHGGRPLPEPVRSFFAPRFGHDFRQVRIHTDARAAEAARTLGARAFTLGRHLVFGDGQFAPGTRTGDRLIAHELTHVLQQNGQALRPSAGTVQGVSLQRSERRIQRAVTYTGASVQQDIDPLDPATAPAGDTAALGHTAFLANGTDIKPLTATPDVFINLLFPLPTVATLAGSCYVTNKELSVNVISRVRVIKPDPWTATLPKSDLGGLLGGVLGGEAACAGSGDAAVTVRGAPSDLALRAWVLEGEMQHAADDACLVDRYMKSYEADVRALPDTFPRGYLGLGSCTSRLEERLKRPERARVFIRDYTRFTNDYDAPGGSHILSAAPTVAPDCSTVNVTVNTGPLPPAGHDCTAWSPPRE